MQKRQLANFVYYGKTRSWRLALFSKLGDNSKPDTQTLMYKQKNFQQKNRCVSFAYEYLLPFA